MIWHSNTKSAKSDKNTDIGNIIVDNGFGWWCESNDLKAFEECIEKVACSNLIDMGEKGYDFYLVDLNRIKITKISPLRGLRNFYRLQADEAMSDVIADEYAALTKQDPQLMSELLKRWTKEHDLRVQKRKLRKGKK